MLQGIDGCQAIGMALEVLSFLYSKCSAFPATVICKFKRLFFFCFVFFFLFFFKRQPHTKQKKVNTAGRVGPKETDYSA